MPSFNLLGPTPSAAAAQQAQWAGYYTGQNNANEAARRSAMVQSLAAQEAQDRADENARQFDVSHLSSDRRYLDALTREDRALALAAEATAEERRRYGLTRGDIARKEAETKKWNWDVLKPHYESEIARNKAFAPAGAAQERIFQEKLLQDMADAGEITSPLHARQIDPTTPPPMAELLARRSMEVRRIKDAAEGKVSNVARILTEDELARRESEAAKKSPDPFFWDWLRPGTPNADREARIAAAANRVQAVAGEASRIKSDKTGLVDTVTYDPATGTYTAPPPWARLSPPGTTTAMPGSNPAAVIQPPVSAPAATPTQPQTALVPLSADQARLFLRQANGDKEAAREMARRAGYSF